MLYKAPGSPAKKNKAVRLREQSLLSFAAEDDSICLRTSRALLGRVTATRVTGVTGVITGMKLCVSMMLYYSLQLVANGKWENLS
jgi:hypothetical protein